MNIKRPLVEIDSLLDLQNTSEVDCNLLGRKFSLRFNNDENKLSWKKRGKNEFKIVGTRDLPSQTAVIGYKRCIRDTHFGTWHACI